MTMARTGSPPTKTLAAFGVLALMAFTALSMSTKSATRFYQWPWFFYWQVLLVVPVAALSGRLLWTARLVRFGRWLDGGLVLFVAANLICALLSDFRAQSLNLALIPVAAVSLAYLCLDWIERDAALRPRRIEWVAEVIGALMLLFVAVSLGLWFFGRVLPDMWSGGSRLGTALRIRNEEPFGHSLYTAGAAVLSAPWLAALGLTGSRRWRALRLFAAALAVVLVTTSSSRGGVAAVVAMAACFAAIWIKHSALSRGRRFLIVAGALAAAAAAVVLDPRLQDLILHRQWGNAANESNRQHAAMAQAGWLMGCDRPLTGYGPGVVPLVYPRYRARLLGGTDNALQLHNTPLQFWAELGAPGMAALFLLAAGIVKCGVDAFRLSGESSRTAAMTAVPGSPDRVRARAAFIAFAGYGVFSLFDSQLDVPWFAFTIAALLVMLRVSSTNPVGASNGLTVSATGARLAGGLLLAGLAAIVWPLVPDLRARQMFWDAANAREAGNDDAFLAGAEGAAALAPQNPFYLTQLAAFQAERYVRADNVADQTRAHDRYCELLRRVLEIDPDQDYCHFNLGWMQLAKQPADAEKHFRASALLSPYRSGVYLGLGLSLLERDKIAATTAFALEWANDPHAVSSPRWDSSQGLGWRDRIADSLHRLADRWLEHEALSTSEQAHVRYVVALTDWWVGRPADMAVLIRNGSPAQRQFFQNLDAIERRDYVLPRPNALEPWETLYVAWRDGTVPSGLDSEQPEFVAALRRRIALHRASFARLLTGSTNGEAGLVRYGRNERPGYSIMARNQDGFPLRDIYVYPENRVAESFVTFLFPEKGYLPNRLLLDAMRELAPAGTAPLTAK